MYTIDESGLEQRVYLMELLRDLTRNPDPVESVNNFARGLRKIWGNQGIISVAMRGLQPGEYRVMRLLHQDGVVDEGYHETGFAGPNALVYRGGLIGEIIAQEKPVVLRDLQIEHDPVLGTELAPYRVIVAVPVFNQGALLNWVLFMSTDSEAFTEVDVQYRLLQANLMGEVGNNKRITHELREATEWILREVDEIAHLQRAMLPQSMPAIQGIDLAAMYETFDRAGGDYYDIFPLGHCSNDMPPPEHPQWGFIIADASGHGPSAAVVIAVLSTLLRAACRTMTTPGDVLAYLNRYLASRPFRYSFVTAFMAFYDRDSGQLKYASAGHNHPLMRLRNGETFELNSVGGLPLGIRENESYDNAETRLESGNHLLLYTDGITEAKSPAGQFFGEEGLLEHLRGCAGEPKGMLDRLLASLREHEAGGRPQDDQTMLMIHRH